jgi:flagellar hook-basal body complex protein FliE
MESAMNIANQAAQKQADNPNSFLPEAFLEQAGKFQEAQSAIGSFDTVATGSAGTGFANMLQQLAQDVSVKSAQAGQAVQGVLAGEGVPLHQAVIAAEEASVSFQLMVEVRNKLLESYQELMRMQV